MRWKNKKKKKLKRAKGKIRKLSYFPVFLTIFYFWKMLREKREG
jgi:hypothetical protein